MWNGDYARGRETARIDVFEGSVQPGQFGWSAQQVVSQARRFDLLETDEYWNGYAAGLRTKGYN